MENDEPQFRLVDENEDELGAEEVDAIGLDSSGLSGDPRFPYTEANLTDEEQSALALYRLENS